MAEVNKQDSNACPICGKEIFGVTPIITLDDRRKGLPGDWRLVKCDACGIVFMEPMPTEEQLATYYAAYSSDEKS